MATIKGTGLYFMYPADIEILTRKLLVANPVKRFSAQQILSEIESYLFGF